MVLLKIVELRKLIFQFIFKLERINCAQIKLLLASNPFASLLLFLILHYIILAVHTIYNSLLLVWTVLIIEIQFFIVLIIEGMSLYFIRLFWERVYFIACRFIHYLFFYEWAFVIIIFYEVRLTFLQCVNISIIFC